MNKNEYGKILECLQGMANSEKRRKQSETFERIGIDFVGTLEKTKRRNRYILVVTNYLTKWPEAKTMKEATAENVVKFIYEGIICRHRCPKIILSDRGTHFRNKLVEGLCEKFEIKHKLSSPYHPQTNGLVERFNRTLCESLAKVSERENQWKNKKRDMTEKSDMKQS